MPARWTSVEEQSRFSELKCLYVRENLTIGQIAQRLGIASQTVFQRMRRLGIPSTPERKATYAARRRLDIRLPKRSGALAEFFGIMLGDGHLAPYQIVVTLGTKEPAYADHVVRLLHSLFGVRPRIAIRKNNSRDVYLGSLTIVEWSQAEGLVHDKVRSQISAPRWLFAKREFLRSFLRGFFDTDGSVYRLRFGIQLSFTNKSLPMLHSVRRALIKLGYRPSRISVWRTYLTKRDEVIRFFKEIRPANQKHQERFAAFIKGR